jgi:hypothetical protein
MLSVLCCRTCTQGSAVRGRPVSWCTRSRKAAPLPGRQYASVRSFPICMQAGRAVRGHLAAAGGREVRCSMGGAVRHG